MPPPEFNATPGGRRVVLVTLGSWGDVLPYLAIALGLQERGHQVILATSACYRERVEALGLSFRSVRPDSDWVADPALMRRRSHPGLGLIRVAPNGCCPPWRKPTRTRPPRPREPTCSCPTRSLLTPPGWWRRRREFPGSRRCWFPSGSSRSMTGRRSRCRRSCRRPSAGSARGSGRRCSGPARATRFLARPWYRLRPELDLPPATDGNPLSESHSPDLNLALFSKLLADPQPDWPPQTVITGFPISSRPAAPACRLSSLDSWTAARPRWYSPSGRRSGPTPGGSTRRAWRRHAGAGFSGGVRRVGRAGATRRRPRDDHPRLRPVCGTLPRAAVVVHHGGIGTTGLAMRSGRPMLVMPRAWDQPDNAARVARLGIARVLPRHRYTASRVASELRHLLGGAYRQRALAVRDQLGREDGVGAACDAIEARLASSASPDDHGG